MKKQSEFLWLAFGIVYGLVMRVLFSHDLFHQEVISIAFMIGTPFVCGAIIVYGLRDTKPKISKMIFAPWLAIFLSMIGAAISLLEGSICIALASPLFLLLSSFGGLAMGLALRWTNKNKTALNSFLILPIALAAIEPTGPYEPKIMEEHVSITIAAEPHKIWSKIINARDIQHKELPFNFTHWIGVPRPVEGVNVMTPEGEVRYSKWERGVNFSALVTHKIQDRSITWRYRFTDKSFPNGSMDDHVKIGGKYFNLYDTTFNLTPISKNLTKLEIVSHYSVTTDVNFYALPIANFIAHDFMSTILSLYKERSEKSTG
jgi:hypothetical protein